MAIEATSAPGEGEPATLTLEERVRQLEGLLAAQREELARLRAPAATPPLHADTPRGKPRRNSRRALLKLGGAAAAAGVAALAAGATELAHPGTAQAAAGVFDSSGVNTNAVTATGTMGATGVSGTSDTSYGVHGFGGPAGVHGSSVGTGVQGENIAADGTAGGIGVHGISNHAVMGAGVQGEGLGYGGNFSGGRANLLLPPSMGAGAPSGTGHAAGEVYVDADAVLWYCVGTDQNGVGTWIRLAGVRSGVPGGALNYLPAPIRIYDTRSGSPAPLPASKGALSGQSSTTIQVTGTDVGGLHVPAGATGVFGNLTVTNTSGPGDLILWP
ncbi:MAG TPA: hypothetical protein VGR57_06205, partial [Ktedonobacterales bacterium]|nr:hypothetical protein [Ktedonobacterales bacterium]